MDEIEVIVEIRESVKLKVGVRDIIWGMEDLPIGEKWAATANILDGIKLSEELTDSQREIIVKFLKKQLAKFEKTDTIIPPKSFNNPYF